MKPTEMAASSEARLRQNVEMSTLCAFYGGLLTERQRSALLLHYDEDWSLGEIAQQYGVSRQNIHDLITRSAQKLQRMEEQIGAIGAARQNSAKLEEALTLLRGVQEAPQSQALAQPLDTAIRLIAETITHIQGEE
ncbi:MAG: sigma factor-like helix-turn-helix DNA-binding protein [Candidatus Limiplasma sp.]|nr:sigma factor-like helix-turn-helix DNA-binding protein [Candidatus Limiplasma sp.]